MVPDHFHESDVRQNGKRTRSCAAPTAILKIASLARSASAVELRWRLILLPRKRLTRIRRLSQTLIATLILPSIKNTRSSIKRQRLHQPTAITGYSHHRLHLLNIAEMKQMKQHTASHLRCMVISKATIHWQVGQPQG